MERHIGREWMCHTSLRTRCIPDVNYSIHGYFPVVRGAQGLQKCSLLSLKGKETSDEQQTQFLDRI